MSTTGTVKWYDAKEGRGVITPDDGSREVTVVATVIPPGVTLKQGQKVEFEASAIREGLMATKVLVAPR